MPKRRASKPKAPPLREVPPPPATLGEHGKAYWQRLAPLLIDIEALTPLHLESFQVLCEQWQTYRELSDWLAEDPSRMTFTTDSGYEQETPQVRIRDKALVALQRLWPKFGLTPEALAKLGKHAGAKGNQLTPLEQFAAEKYADDE